MKCVRMINSLSYCHSCFWKVLWVDETTREYMCTRIIRQSGWFHRVSVHAGIFVCMNERVEAFLIASR